MVRLRIRCGGQVSGLLLGWPRRWEEHDDNVVSIRLFRVPGRHQSKNVCQSMKRRGARQLRENQRGGAGWWSGIEDRPGRTAGSGSDADVPVGAIAG